MAWIVVPGFVALTAVVLVRKALMGYGAAAAAVDERKREHDTDNAMFAQPIRHDRDMVDVVGVAPLVRESSAAGT